MPAVRAEQVTFRRARFSADRVFWLFLAVHTLTWWALPAVLQHDLPLDMVEQLAWGREWQIVYFKHPPLPAWILELLASAFGRWPPAMYLAGSLSSALALLAIWRLGCHLFDRRRALLAVLVQECVLYFTIFTPEFNHNVVLLPLWAAIGLAGYRVCFTEKRNWVWLGVLIALGMLGKYTTALLVLPLLVLAIAHPRLRRMWAGPGPWVACLVALLVLTPHLLGLWRIDFSPLLFPFERAPGPAHWYDHIVDPLLFLGGQVGDLAPAVLALALLAWRPAAGPPTRLPADVRAYLWTITWAPVGIAVALSLILGLHMKDMWGYPMWCFFALFLMAEVAGPVTDAGLRQFAAAWPVIFLAVAGVFVIQQTVGGFLLRKPLRTQFPGRELASLVEQRWHAVAGNAPLAIVVGDVWYAGNIAFYGTERPSVFIDADFRKSPWITQEMLRRRGAVLIWENPGASADLLKSAPDAVPQQPIELPYVPALGHAPARLFWAILPPAA